MNMMPILFPHFLSWVEWEKRNEKGGELMNKQCESF
jgi:hypothetical protein